MELLENLVGAFYTKDEELIEDVKDCGFTVDYIDYENLVISDEDDNEITLKLIRACNTVAIDFGDIDLKM